MKKPIKITLVVLASLFILFIAGIGILLVSLDSIIEKSVTVFGTKMTGTKVELKDVSLSLLGADLTLKDFSVGNPSGYASTQAFDLKKLRADVERNSIFSDNIVINEIVIDGAVIAYEPQINGTSNLSDIKKNVETNTGMAEKKTDTAETKSTTTETTEESTTESKQKKTVEIKLFKMTNCKVIVSSKLLNNQKITVPLPDIQLTDIGGKDKKNSSPEEVFAYIYDDILMEIVKAVSSAPDAAAVKDSLKSLGSATESVVDETKKAGEKIIDSVKNLF